MKTSLFIHLQALKVSESKRRPEKAERKRGRKAEREKEHTGRWKLRGSHYKGERFNVCFVELKVIVN